MKYLFTLTVKYYIFFQGRLKYLDRFGVGLRGVKGLTSDLLIVLKDLTGALVLFCVYLIRTPFRRLMAVHRGWDFWL